MFKDKLSKLREGVSNLTQKKADQVNCKANDEAVDQSDKLSDLKVQLLKAKSLLKDKTAAVELGEVKRNLANNFQKLKSLKAKEDQSNDQ